MKASVYRVLSAYVLPRLGASVGGQGFFQVDDVDLVAMTEDERCHLGVPEAGLVSKVDAGFQHFAHGYCHKLLQRFGLKLGSFIGLQEE